MKNHISIFIASVLSIGLGAIESDTQFENDQVRVLKIKILPHEEIALQRDDYPSITISFKGGTLTQIDSTGAKTSINFPKGEAIYRDPDPEGQLHTTINDTCKPLELVIVQLK